MARRRRPEGQVSLEEHRLAELRAKVAQRRYELFHHPSILRHTPLPPSPPDPWGWRDLDAIYDPDRIRDPRWPVLPRDGRGEEEDRGNDA